MKLNEIKNKMEAERKAKEEAFAPITVDGVKAPSSTLDGLELPDLSGIPSDVLFCIADISYRVAGIRTSRLVQSDPAKEIGVWWRTCWTPTPKIPANVSNGLQPTLRRFAVWSICTGRPRRYISLLKPFQI